MEKDVRKLRMKLPATIVYKVISVLSTEANSLSVASFNGSYLGSLLSTNLLDPYELKSSGLLFSLSTNSSINSSLNWIIRLSYSF